MTVRINGNESYVQNRFKLLYLIPLTFTCCLINCFIEKTTEPFYTWVRDLRSILKYDGVPDVGRRKLG